MAQEQRNELMALVAEYGTAMHNIGRVHESIGALLASADYTVARHAALSTTRESHENAARTAWDKIEGAIVPVGVSDAS